MKVLWVLDEENSALSISAKSKAIVDSEFLYSVDFISVTKVVARILNSNADIIVFSWRQVLRDILGSYRASQLLASLSMTSKLVVLVADYLDSSPQSLAVDSKMFLAADAVLTTNQDLLDIYSNALGDRLIFKKFFDTVNSSPIVGIAAKYPKVTNQVIWVGNSKWGHRQGMQDHKGFERIVKPLAEMCRNFGCDHKYVYIDSSIKRIPHDLVIQLIAKSEYLIQASDSEGTGMPILESLMCGTVPITTSVGVAPEILQGDLSFLLAKSNPESFFEILHNPRSRFLVNSTTLSFAYSKHAKFDFKAPLELINKSNASRSIIPAKKYSCTVGLIYIFRFFRNKLLIGF